MQRDAEKKLQFPGFNGLRFFAAAAVVCFHYGDPEQHLHFSHPYLSNIVQSGPAALGFFFMLSGFVLAHASQGRPLHWKTFWWARFARLYPVYLLAFLLFAPLAAVKYIHMARNPKLFLLAGVENITLLQSWTPLAIAWNGPSWSLSDEAFFYALFPFLFAPLMRARPFTLLILGGMAWLAQLGLFIGHIHGMISVPVWHRWFQYNPVFWLPLFVLGIITYRVHGFWLGRPAWFPSALTLMSFALMLWLAATVSPITREFLECGGFAPLFALLLLCFSHPGNRFEPLLAGRTFALLGAASYAIYILQAPAAHYSMYLVQKLHLARLESFLLVFLCLLVVAVLAHLYVEQPARKWLMSLHPGQKPTSQSGETLAAETSKLLRSTDPA